ncbi:LCP family protein [Enteractinococcus coprophilus]|uniref:LCP family protein n=1 Tax=Enteractinococcus coprophilus TaxID=1027633 RepID=UPI0011530D41|nr:LCP family protein [Enteractinococcus coprophilus]
MTDNTLDLPETEDRSPRKKNKKVLFWVLGSFLVVLLIAGGIVWAAMSKLQDFETIEQAFPEETLRPEVTKPVEGQDDPAVNILLLGSDSRANTSTPVLDDIGNRADTIMVAHIPSDRSGVQIMSIMRDSWLEIPGHGEAKINAAMAYGGVPLMVQTVEGLIDQRIDHVAVIDFNGFQNMTDSLGGVEVNNPRAFSYDGVQFAQGPITLNGEEALTFVRSRNFSDGDYTRVENQQLFMESMAAEILSRDTLTSPSKLNDLVESTTPYVALDGDFGVGSMVGLGTSMSSVRAGDITSFTLPTRGTGREGGGQSVVYVDWDALDEVRERFKNDELADYQPAAK